MNTLKLIVRYVYGIFCMIGAISLYSQSILSFVLFLSTGLFILPFTHNLILSKFNILLDTSKRYFISFGLFTLSCFTTTFLDTTSKTEQNNKYLFESVEDFRNDFNDFSEKTSLEYKIENIVVKKGETYDSFNLMLNPNIGLIGQVDKENGKVINITSLASGDGTTASVIKVMVVFTSLIAVIDKNVKPENRLKIMQDLGFLNDKVKVENISDSTFVNGNRYYLGYIKGMGLMFNVSKDNKKR